MRSCRRSTIANLHKCQYHIPQPDAYYEMQVKIPGRQRENVLEELHHFELFVSNLCGSTFFKQEGIS